MFKSVVYLINFFVWCEVGIFSIWLARYQYFVTLALLDCFGITIGHCKARAVLFRLS